MDEERPLWPGTLVVDDVSAPQQLEMVTMTTAGFRTVGAPFEFYFDFSAALNRFVGVHCTTPLTDGTVGRKPNSYLSINRSRLDPDDWAAVT
jgi:hypothetical protein